MYQPQRPQQTLSELIDAGLIKVILEETGDSETSGFYLGIFDPVSGEYGPF